MRKPGYIWFEKDGRRRRVPDSRNGKASSLDEQKGVVVIRHVVGFGRQDWGEGNWTAADLR